MNLLPAQTPLYNHPLHQLEHWLEGQGCYQDETQAHCWHWQGADWTATLYLEETALRAEYHQGEANRTLTFPYSLSRWDVEQAVFNTNPNG